MAERKCLSEESLEKVTGGTLNFVWDAETQVGYVYSSCYNTGKKYYFNADNFNNVTNAVFHSVGNGKADQEDLADMQSWFYKVE